MIYGLIKTSRYHSDSQPLFFESEAVINTGDSVNGYPVTERNFQVAEGKVVGCMLTSFEYYRPHNEFSDKEMERCSLPVPDFWK